jgi:23S rRNA (adenine2503-C2)-methyltransferase
LAQNSPIDPQILKSYFSPDLYLIKITPLNPTYRAHEHQMTSYLQAEHNAATDPLIDKLRDVGFEVIVSIGEIIENQIGSNCGQYIERHRKSSSQLVDGYADCTTT